MGHQTRTNSVPVFAKQEMKIMESALSVQLVESLEGLYELVGEWNELLCASQSNTIFLTWHWQTCWAKCFVGEHRRLFVACVRRGKELVAIAPWYIETSLPRLLSVRSVRFIGAPESGSDYLDVIIQKGQEKIAAQVLYDFLFGVGRQYWDELRLLDVPAESLFLLHFMNCMEKQGKYVDLGRSGYLPQTFLPVNADDFLNALSANRRYKYRYDVRRLGQEGAVDHTTYSGDCIASGFERFFPLYNEKSGYKDGPNLQRFLEILCLNSDSRKWIQIDILSVGGVDVSGLLHLRYGQNLALLKMVVDKAFNRKTSIGNVLVGMCINRAIGEGITCYDFLKGDEDYKFHWARTGRVTLSVTMRQRRMMTIFITATRLAKDFGKMLLR